MTQTLSADMAASTTSDPSARALSEVRDLLIQRMIAALSDPDAPPSAALFTAIARILRECGALRLEGASSAGPEAEAAPPDDAPDFGPLAEPAEAIDTDPETAVQNGASDEANDLGVLSGP